MHAIDWKNKNMMIHEYDPYEDPASNMRMKQKLAQQPNTKGPIQSFDSASRQYVPVTVSSAVDPKAEGLGLSSVVVFRS